VKNKEGKEVTTKPWALSAWKQIRKEKLDDHCQQCGSTKPPLVLHHPLVGKSRSRNEFDQYLSCEETVTFCKKCSFLWDMKGMNLCPRCKTHYKKFQFPNCYRCSKELGIIHPTLMEQLGITKDQEAKMDKELDSMHGE
jgi:hypothetical protein